MRLLPIGALVNELLTSAFYRLLYSGKANLDRRFVLQRSIDLS